MDNTLLGARLRQERQRLNMTQEKLAEMVDISHAYLGQIERAERSVTLDTLVRLANQLGVTIDDLLHESIEMSDEFYANKINKLLNNRSIQEQKMALEMLELMFLHLEDICSGKTV